MQQAESFLNSDYTATYSAIHALGCNKAEYRRNNRGSLPLTFGYPATKIALDSQKLFGIVIIQELDIMVCKCLGEISTVQSI